MNVYVLIVRTIWSYFCEKRCSSSVQNGLSVFVVIHLKASRHWEGLPQGFRFCPLGHFNFTLYLVSSLSPDVP